MRWRNVYGGPLDGSLAEGRNEAFAFIDGNGRAHVEPAAGRVAYRYVFGGWVCVGSDADRSALDDWLAHRAAAERGKQGSCGGCYLASDPGSGSALRTCPLCGQAQQGQAA